jgi:hypothetical protein
LKSYMYVYNMPFYIWTSFLKVRRPERLPMRSSSALFDFLA